MNQFLFVFAYLLCLIDSWIIFCIGLDYDAIRYIPKYFINNQIICMCLLPIHNHPQYTQITTQLIRIQLNEVDPNSFDMNYYIYESLISIIFIISYQYITGEMVLSSMRSIPHQYKFTIGIQFGYPYNMPSTSCQIPLKIRII